MPCSNYSDRDRELVSRLLELIGGPPGDAEPSVSFDKPGPSGPADASWDAIITAFEVNDQHGTGVLLRRIFQGERNILSIRSTDLYEGRHEFGDISLRLFHRNDLRDAAFARVLRVLGDRTVRRVLCVPFYGADVLTALAVKEICGVPMCTYLMDDQNICADGIPDDLMRELLAKSALRLAISPELRIAYELKYGFRISYMPPVVTDRLILSRLNPPPANARPDHGVIIGNIWGHQWLTLLRETVRKSQVTLSWYCNGQFRWVHCSREDLIADSIIPYDPLPEEELLRVLRGEWFAVLPTGRLSEEDDHRFIAQLSLPSRLVYLLTTSQIPVLLLGSPQTAAANFVKQFGIGLVADYERRAFREAVHAITQPETNLAMRRNAMMAAKRFTDAGAADWIWESLALGRPVDQRYEELMPAERPNLAHLLAARSSVNL
jgi:hypothetical protein